MDGGAWWATVHGAANSLTQLSGFTSLISNDHLFVYLFWRNVYLNPFSVLNWVICLLAVEQEEFFVYFVYKFQKTCKCFLPSVRFFLS